MSADPVPPDLARRRFLKTVGLASLTTLGAPALSLAQSKRRPASPARPRRATPAPPPPSAPVTEPAIAEDARALAGVLRRRYGAHLTPAQLEAVTKEIESRLQGGRRLREALLANADEPDFTFRA